MKNKAVFLDRDGVINEVIFRGTDKPIAPWSIEEFRFIKGIKKPLEKLADLGFLLFIISNQPDISKGLIDIQTVETMNNTILSKLPITKIIYCPHEDRHNCSCRKPKPGMLITLSKEYNVNLMKSFLIGDNWKDIEAGKSVGCKSILLNKIYNKAVKADFYINSLTEALKIIKGTSKN